MLLVRDTAGRPLFYLDGEVARDSSGKPVAARSGKDAETATLADRAAKLMSGRKVLLDLAPGDVMTPSVQAEFGIPDGDYVADYASQVRYVTRDRGYFFLENVTDAIKVVSAIADSDAAPNEANPSYASTLFQTTGYALAAKLPRGTVQNADFDVKGRALRHLVNALKLGRETRVATLLTTAANWATANQVSVAHKWNDVASAAPLTDLFSALAASYLPASTVIMPERVAPFYYASSVTSGTTLMRDYVQSGGEMPRTLFARAKKLSAGAPAYVWSPTLPTNVALVRSPDHIPTSVTFRWLGDGGKDGDLREGMLVREFTDPRDGSDWIVVAHHDAEVMVANNVGALIVGALQ